MMLCMDSRSARKVATSIDQLVSGCLAYALLQQRQMAGTDEHDHAVAGPGGL